MSKKQDNFEGVFDDMPSDVYHKAVGVSRSSACKAYDRPDVFYYEDILGNKTSNPAFAYGIAFHTAVLEPEKYELEVAVEPNINKRTKDGKAEFEEWYSANKGKNIITQADHEAIMRARDSVNAHPMAKKIMAQGVAERSFFTKHELLEDATIKARTDWLSHGVIVDLKSARSASTADFAKQMTSTSYIVQPAWYLDVAKRCGEEVDEFWYIAVEKTAPYSVAVYRMSPNSHETRISEFLYEQVLIKYNQLKKDGLYPSYNNNEVTDIELPHWFSRNFKEIF